MAAAMKQWKSLVALHSAAPSCFPQPTSLCPSPPREAEDKQHQQAAAVRLVGCDGRVRTYRRPVTARELMQQHPRHLVCRSDALLIGEKIPAVALTEELQPGQAYFLLPVALGPRRVFSYPDLPGSASLCRLCPPCRPCRPCRAGPSTAQSFVPPTVPDSEAWPGPPFVPCRHGPPRVGPGRAGRASGWPKEARTKSQL